MQVKYEALNSGMEEHRSYLQMYSGVWQLQKTVLQSCRQLHHILAWIWEKWACLSKFSAIWFFFKIFSIFKSFLEMVWGHTWNVKYSSSRILTQGTGVLKRAHTIQGLHKMFCNKVLKEFSLVYQRSALISVWYFFYAKLGKCSHPKRLNGHKRIKE